MLGTERRVVALIAGMAAGAGLGILLSSLGRRIWIEKFDHILDTGDTLKRMFTYRISSALERSGLTQRKYDFDDYISSS